MNMKDIALLRFSSIDGSYLRFTRAKTQESNRVRSKQISIFISHDLRRIIDKWRNQEEKPEDFLFPILKDRLTPQRQLVLIQQFTKMVNTYMKLIAEELEIYKPITTYYARHSFATILRRSGTSTELISESLNHANVKTTVNYLDSFDDESKKDLANRLANFNPRMLTVPN